MRAYSSCAMTSITYRVHLSIGTKPGNHGFGMTREQAMRRANWSWTADDETKLRELADKGVHLRAIALRLRRSESSIRKRAHELKIAVRRPPRTRLRADTLFRGYRQHG